MGQSNDHSTNVQTTSRSTTATKKPRLLTVKRAAEAAGIPYTSARDMALRGEFPLVRIGRRLYTFHDAIDRWIDAHVERGD